MSPRSEHTSTRIDRVVTPSGAPPFLLPTGDYAHSEPDPNIEETHETEFDNAEDAIEALAAKRTKGLDLTSGTSGLLSSSDALSSAVTPKGSKGTLARTRSASKPVQRPSYKDAGRGPRPVAGALVPSDEAIDQWCKDIRTWGRKNGGLYTADALCYWARYSFDPFTPEYKEVRDKIHAFVGVN